MVQLSQDSREGVRAKVFECIAEVGGVELEMIREEHAWKDDLGMDSLDVLDLIMTLEREFDLKIPDSDAEELTTVKLAVDYTFRRVTLAA
ncbi:MAG TPA: acyl carrier protein [Candidatus Parcubacteria bacterium]|nr:acyl carrier protein [Candidatus Parcubacteria bacterium]